VRMLQLERSTANKPNDIRLKTRVLPISHDSNTAERQAHFD